MSGGAPPSGFEPRWQRLHPLTPLVIAFRFAPAVVLLYIPSIGRHDSGGGASALIAIAIAAGLLVVGSIVSVVVTRWRFDGEVMSIKTGLLRRDERQLPVTRIQSVDIVRPLVARMVGLAELRIRLAGAGGTRGRLAFLSLEEADGVRARLLAAHHGLDPRTPEPAERRLLAVGFGRLVASVLITDLGLVTVVVIAAIVVLAINAQSVLIAVVGGGASALLGLGRALVGRVVSEFGFVAAEAPDGLRVRSGLLQTSSETIPRGRVQAVRQVEPLLWRPFGWCRLEVDVAGGVGNRRGGRGRSGAARVTKTLLPVGTAAEAALMLARVLGVDQIELVRPPRRAAIKAPLGYRFLAAGYDHAHAVTVNGRLRKTTAWVPLEKVQSVRLVQGPLQRSLGLASVHLDTAGRRVHAIFRDRDALEADRLLVSLTSRCRAARVQGHQSAPTPVRPGERGPGEPVADGGPRDGGRRPTD